MAIAYDNQSSTSLTGSRSSYSFNHTVSGSDRFLFVANAIQVPSGIDVSSITYNGTALTQVATFSPQDLQANFPLSLYYLDDPATGTNSVAVTLTTTSTSAQRSIATSYTGVDFSGGFGDADGNKLNTSSTVTISLTNATDQAWLIGVGAGLTTFTSYTNATLRGSQVGSTAFSMFDTNGGIAPTTTTVTLTLGDANENPGMIGVVLNPAASATTIKTVDGVARASVKTYLGVASASIKTINGIT